MIGSGVLALPSCAAKVGWLLAIILMVVSAGITWVGVHFLTSVAHKMGGDQTSFGKAAARTYPWMMVIVDLCVFSVTFGVCVAYLVCLSALRTLVRILCPACALLHVPQFMAQHVNVADVRQ